MICAIKTLYEAAPPKSEARLWMNLRLLFEDASCLWIGFRRLSEHEVDKIDNRLAFISRMTWPDSFQIRENVTQEVS